MSDTLSGSLQENLLVLLCYSETSYLLIRNTVDPKLFTTEAYRDLVQRVYAYIDQFKSPPKDHLPDLVEDAMPRRSGELYRAILDAILRVKETINEEFVLTQLEKFIRQQTLKVGIIKASTMIQDGKLDEAEVVLERSLKQRLSLFSPGMSLKNGLDMLVSGETLRDPLPLGIPEIDRYGIGPARKELFSFIAVKKKGKTWWLIHLAKRALMYGWRVAYITLEVGEKLMTVRTLQSIFSLTHGEAERIMVTTFKKDELGRVSSFLKEGVKRPPVESKEGLKLVKRGLAKMHITQNIRIKEFASGTLTMQGLEAYLDALERVDNFVPDMLIVDYPALMDLDAKYLRIELGGIYRDLRGLGQTRNMAVAIVGQSNREGAEAKNVTGTHTAEDYSLNATSDIVVTYSQTDAEYELGLARLRIDASRVSRQQITIMVSQAYELGQFCLDSAMMMDNYWGRLEKMTGKNPLEGE